MNRTNDAFDDDLRRERIRLLLGWASGAALVGALLGTVVYLAVPGDVRVVRGTVLAVHAVSHEEGHSRYVDVALDGGDRIKAGLPGHLPFRAGASAELVQTEGRFSRALRYSVRSYAE